MRTCSGERTNSERPPAPCPTPQWAQAAPRRGPFCTLRAGWACPPTLWSPRRRAWQGRSAWRTGFRSALRWRVTGRPSGPHGLLGEVRCLFWSLPSPTPHRPARAVHGGRPRARSFPASCELVHSKIMVGLPEPDPV